MKRISTQYPHTFNADGTRRDEPCAGYLEVVCDRSGVYVCCDACGEGYRFQFVMRHSDEVANRGDGHAPLR